MQLDQSPFFRKPITPWYDAGVACWIIILFSFLVLTFALVGLYTGIKTPAFHKYLWVPGALATSGLFLLTKISLRLKNRYKNN